MGWGAAVWFCCPHTSRQGKARRATTSTWTFRLLSSLPAPDPILGLCFSLSFWPHAGSSMVNGPLTPMVSIPKSWALDRLLLCMWYCGAFEAGQSATRVARSAEFTARHVWLTASSARLWYLLSVVAQRLRVALGSACGVSLKHRPVCPVTRPHPRAVLIAKAWSLSGPATSACSADAATVSATRWASPVLRGGQLGVLRWCL